MNTKFLFIYSIYLLSFIFFLGMAVPHAHGQTGIPGDWEGTLELPGAKLKLIFHITEEQGAYSATWDSPDQGANGLVADAVSVEENTVNLKLMGGKANYRGNYQEKEDQLWGKFMQGGMKLDLILSRQQEDERKVAENPTTPVTGDWYGKLETPMGKLRMVFHITEYEDGELSALLDSPDQGASGIAASAIAYEGETLTVEMMGGSASFTGDYKQEGEKIEGTFRQGGQEIPLVMEREKIEGPKRPQTPKAPFPYKEEKVKYPNEEADLELGATLTLPAGKGPHPVVIMISGSGAQDRDESILGHQPFWVIADYMSRRGIAVLRFDDRGVGESTGDHSTATSADFATDVEAGIAYLQTRKDIDKDKIGLMGHSEGGMIAPIVASRNKEVNFIILLAGPGTNGAKLLALQQKDIMEAQGMSAGTIEKWATVNERIYKILQEEPTAEGFRERVEGEAVMLLKDMSDEEKEALDVDEERLATSVAIFGSPWFRYFLTFNPEEYLEKVSCSVLAVNGEKDLQVSSKGNLAGIEQALKKGENPDFEVKEFAGLNHLFQKSETGNPAEYATLEETFSEEVMEYVYQWIAARTQK